MAKLMLMGLLILLATTVSTAWLHPEEGSYMAQALGYNYSSTTMRADDGPKSGIPHIGWGVKVGPPVSTFDVMLLQDTRKKGTPEKEILVSSEDYSPCPYLVGMTPNVNWFELKYVLGEGFFGTVSMVLPYCTTKCPKPNLVLKDAKVQNNPWAYPAALREAYFGSRLSTIPASLQGTKHLARFVDAFGTEQKFSVVSMFEGISLHAALYESDSFGIERHWWKWLKTTSEGNAALQEIMRQMISGLALLHSFNITHRDLKPDNIVLCFYVANGDCIAKPTIGSAYRGLHVRLIDFGSGLDAYSSNYLYGDEGPTRGTQDIRYMSPECYIPLDPQICVRKGSETLARIDMFSVGITYLEIILMTEEVLPNRGGGRFLDICVGKTDLPAHCSSEKSFLKYIKERDPLKIGFPGIRGLRFAQQLLNMDIGKRLTAKKALEHPYLSSDVLVDQIIEL